MAGIAVAAVGDNCIDRYRSLGISTVGGNAVNVAVHLARAGLATGYFGAVGRDPDGDRVLAALRDNRVDAAHLRLALARTAFTEIGIAAHGERIIALENFGACAGYRPDAAERALLAGLRHVHIGWLDDGGALRADLSAAGTSVSQDLSVNLPGPPTAVAGLAIAFASAGPSLAEGRGRLAALMAEGAGTAVVTCGPLGSLAADASATAAVDALPLPVVDTLGAGDTFIAAFIAARLAGASLRRCLEAGRDAAAATCGHFGGFPQVPIKMDHPAT